MRTFLVCLETRPDGVVNQSITSYSSLNATMSQFYSKCASASSSTIFTKVFVMVLDNDGTVYESRTIDTLYEEE